MATPPADTSSPINSVTSIQTALTSKIISNVAATQTLSAVSTTNSSINASFVSTSTQTVFSTTFSHITITLETETTSPAYISPANRIRVPAVFAAPRLAVKALAAVPVFNSPGAEAQIERARRSSELRTYEQADVARPQGAGFVYALRVRGKEPGEQRDVNDTLSASWNGTTGSGRLTCTGQVAGGDVGFNCEKSGAMSSMPIPRIFKLPILFGNLISRIPYSLAAAARPYPPLSSSPSPSSFPPQSADEMDVPDATKTAGGDAGTEVQNVAARVTTCVTEPLGSLPGAPFCYDNSNSDEGESAGTRSLSIPRIFKLPLLLVSVVTNMLDSLTQRIASTEDTHERAVGNWTQRLKRRECYGDPESALGFTCSAGTRTMAVSGLFKLPVILANFISHFSSSLAERISSPSTALALRDTANTT
jgi:hypothetical protein